MIFDAAAKKVHISVEELCHTVVNHASIDTRGARLYPDKGKVAEWLTGKHGLAYTEDVSLSRTVSRGGLFYEVSGVCDGVLREGGNVAVNPGAGLREHKASLGGFLKSRLSHVRFPPFRPSWR